MNLAMPTRRQFGKQTAMTTAGLATFLMGTNTPLAANKPKEFPGISGVDLAIATICTDGFGNHHYEPAFRLIPQLGFEVLVTLENHANNVLERPEDYDKIFSAIDSPNIGMCLDTGHFEGVNVDLHQVIDRFHKRILHVDLKDCRARGKGHDTVPFGEGVTDFDAFLSHLLEKSYQGYLVVEQAWSQPKGDWVSDLKQAYEKFRPWIRQGQ